MPTPKLIGPLKKDSENRLETTAVLNGGTATIGAISNTSFDQGAVSDHGRWIQGLDYSYMALRYVRVNSEGKLETVGIIESGTIGEVGRVGTVGNISDIGRIGTIGDIEHLGSIANTKFNQGSLDDHDRWIKGDDVGTKRYVKVDGDGKLQTVSLLEAGTSVIGNLDRVATVGQIDHLGSIGNVSFDQGSVTDHKRRMYINEYGAWAPLQGTYGRLKTVSVLEASTAVIGDVRRVGTVGVIDHLGSIANTEFDIGRVGTIGDIEHLGSIANTSFDQGSVSDHKREMYMRQLGTWIPVEGEDENLKTVSVLQHGTASIGDINTVATVGHVDSLGSIANVSEVSRVGTVGDIEHLGSIANTKFNQGSLDDHDRWIKGDDVGTKRYVKVDGDGKLQTVGVLEAGTSVIGNLDHVATVGRIDRLGSIGNVSFDQGSVTDHRRRMYINEYGTWVPLQGTYGSPYVVPLMDRSGVLIPFDSSPNAELRVAIGYNGSAFTTIRLDASNRLQHAPATTRKGGKKLVTNMGTAVALVGPSTPCISVIVKALHTNAGEVYVGDNTVGSATGYILQKDEFVSLSADDVNGVYIDRNAGTQGVSFLYVNY